MLRRAKLARKPAASGGSCALIARNSTEVFARVPRPRRRLRALAGLACPDCPGSGQPEVEDLHRARRRDHDVLGLQISMDNAFDMRGVERIDDLPRDTKHVGKASGSGFRLRSPSVSPSISSIAIARTLPAEEATSQRRTLFPARTAW